MLSGKGDATGAGEVFASSAPFLYANGMDKPDHDALIAAVPDTVRGRMLAIQSAVERAVPEATRTVGYGMPAFRTRRIFFYFGAFKDHIGVYPPVRDTGLMAQLAPYAGPKGNLTFKHNEPLPLDLIERTAAALAAQYAD